MKDYYPKYTKKLKIKQVYVPVLTFRWSPYFKGALTSSQLCIRIYQYVSIRCIVVHMYVCMYALVCTSMYVWYRLYVRH